LKAVRARRRRAGGGDAAGPYQYWFSLRLKRANSKELKGVVIKEVKW